jgi:AcrB/AcrD/AcrF family
VLRGFQQYEARDEHRRVTEPYNVQLTSGPAPDPAAKVVIMTIQRWFGMLMRIIFSPPHRRRIMEQAALHGRSATPVTAKADRASALNTARTASSRPTRPIYRSAELVLGRRGPRLRPDRPQRTVGSMNLSAPFIERPVATSLLMAAVLLCGLAAFFSLPIAALPQVDIPTIHVSATLPGASADTIAATVTTLLERQLQLISGVTEMTSTSTLGESSIILQFDLNRNIDAAAQDVQTAINAAASQLPKTLPNPPIYEKANPSDFQIRRSRVRVPADALSKQGVRDNGFGGVEPR